MKGILLLIFIAGAVAIQCLPPYQPCPNGSCAIFADQCGVCTSGNLVCPDGATCVAQYTKCPRLPFLDETLPIEKRLDDLIPRLSLQEKVNQLMYPAPAIERLGIPEYNWLNEALHGVARAGLATSFPQIIGLGSTFDSNLFHRVGRAIAEEARAKHNLAISQNDIEAYKGLSFYAPNINIYRDPRWGRGQEVPGEDPFLNGQYAVNLVQGMQNENQDPRYFEVISCCKHFAVYNFENQSDVNRHNFDAQVTMRDLHETYLPAFKKCVIDAHVQSIMCSYNSVNGVPACANSFLMQEILRDKWGFDGFVISDYDSVSDAVLDHKFFQNFEDASAACLTAGCDQDGGQSYTHLTKAYQEGLVSSDVINTAVRRMFSARMKLGMMDPPSLVPYNYIPYSINDSPQHRQLALEAALKSIVLMKNVNFTLPLYANELKTILVVGPNANDTETLLGNYAGTPPYIVTILEGIQARVPGVNVLYSQGCDVFCTDTSGFGDALKKAKEADVIIAVMGMNGDIENEELDRVDLYLPGLQESFLQQLQSVANTPMVLVLVNGGSLIMPWASLNIPAIVEAYYPGQSGGSAVAQVLFGDYSPAGRLTTTWVSSMTQLPNYLSTNMYDFPGRTYRFYSGVPQYPFGFGLSYTSFTYSNLTVSQNEIVPCQNVQVSVQVQNSGQMKGDEVIQVYLSLLNASVPVAHVQLVAFSRVSLGVGQMKTVNFEISYEQMGMFMDDGTQVIGPGMVLISVGGGQPKYYEGGLDTIVNIVAESLVPVDTCQQ